MVAPSGASLASLLTSTGAAGHGHCCWAGSLSGDSRPASGRELPREAGAAELCRGRAPCGARGGRLGLRPRLGFRLSPATGVAAAGTAPDVPRLICTLWSAVLLSSSLLVHAGRCVSAALLEGSLKGLGSEPAGAMAVLGLAAALLAATPLGLACMSLAFEAVRGEAEGSPMAAAVANGLMPCAAHAAAFATVYRAACASAAARALANAAASAAVSGRCVSGGSAGACSCWDTGILRNLQQGV